MINQNIMLCYNYIEGLTALQINFIRAITDGVHDGFSRQEILSKYNLGVSANISRIKKSLKNYALAAMKGWQPCDDDIKNLNISPEHKYFNNGLLILNCDKWREEKIADKLINRAKEGTIQN